MLCKTCPFPTLPTSLTTLRITRKQPTHAIVRLALKAHSVAERAGIVGNVGTKGLVKPEKGFGLGEFGDDINGALLE